MITEDYVSFETAKLLKEKGFEYNPDESYWLIDADNTLYWISSIGAYDYVDTPTESFQRPKNGYRLVTQAMAMKWLREVHNILLVVDYDYEFTSTSYIYKIYRLVENGRPERVIVKGTSYDKDNNPTEHIVAVRDYERSAEEYATYQQAAEAGIKYCLESI